MDQRQLLVRRSAAQLLDRPVDGGPEAGVRALLAVQAQDKSAWRLALRPRVAGITAADVNAALTEQRSLVVSWLNRGTLHLVCSEDYSWLWALSAPTQRVAIRSRLAREGFSREESDRGVALIERWLIEDGPLSRGRLRERLKGRGFNTEGQAVVHLLFAAANRGLAVLGPLAGGEHLFAHPQEWLNAAQQPKALAGERRDIALAELARRYLRGHGPATAADFVKWSGLPLRDVHVGFRGIGAELVELEGDLLDLADRRPSAFQLEARAATEPLPARLLPGFDPCLLGWRERRPFVRPEHEPKVIPPGGGVFRAVATVDGVAAATWGLRRQGTRVAVHVDPFEPFDPAVEEAIAAEAADVARFEGRELVMEWPAATR
jgi:Winged helix DNA-binding domain